MAAKKIFAVILSVCAVVALCATGALAEDVEATSSTPWYYLDSSSAKYRNYGKTQLQASDLVSGAPLIMRLDFPFSKINFNGLDNFIQVDIYLTASAASPGYNDNLRENGVFFAMRWGKQFISNYPAGSGPATSLFENVNALDKSYYAEGKVAICSFVIDKQQFLDHIFSQSGTSKVTFMLHCRDEYVQMLSSSSVLFFSARSVVTDDIQTDEKTLAIIQTISEQINSGMLDLADAQEAATQAIRSGNAQAHEDAGKTQDAIEQGAQDVVDAIEQQQQNEKDEAQSAVDEASDDANAEASSTFDISAFGNALSDFAGALTYSGSDFSFKLPASGVVPFLDRELWQETEIPFKTYIDALPAAAFYVIRFLAWLGLIFSVIATIKKLIADFNGGNEE